MERIPVANSSQILSIGYDPSILRLEIEFKPFAGQTSSSVYIYDNVAAETYTELMRAPSKGSYFQKYIKGNYVFKKVA